MKLILNTAACGVFCLLSSLVSPISAEMMPGPGIVGQVEGGGVHVIQLYADNGDRILDASDHIWQVKSTDSDGNFSFDNLDMDNGYFVLHNGLSSPLQQLGGIKSFIDSFDITQSVSANPNTGFRLNSAKGPQSSILGGIRDFYVDVLSGTAEAQLRANPFSRTSNLQIDMSAGVSGMVSVTWDGVEGGMVPEHGLSTDLTHGGMYTGISLRHAVDKAGAGQLLKLMLYSEEGMSEKEIEFVVTPTVSPGDLTFIPFEGFSGDADPRSISAIQLMLDETMPSLDARISGIGLTGPNTVSFPITPEPASGILLLLGWAFISHQFRIRRPLATRS